MIIISRSPKIALAALATSLLIFGVVYFTVIKPSSDTANTALKHATQQSDQVVKSVDKQAKQAGGTGVPSRVKKLTACMAAAGADVTKIQSCQAKFGS